MLHTSQFTVGRTKGPVCATNFCFWWTVPLNFERVGFVYQKSSTYIKTILHFFLFCETDSSINLHLNNCYEKIAYIRWLSLVHWIGKVLFFTSYIYIDISIYLHIYLYISIYIYRYITPILEGVKNNYFPISNYTLFNNFIKKKFSYIK